MVYFEESYLRVTYNEEMKAVFMEWQTYATSQELRKGLEKGLELIKLKNASKWFADVQALGIISEEDQQWSNEDWFPRAIAGGIRKMAVLVSSDIFNQMTVEEIMSKVPKINFVSQTFDDPNEAKKWLAKSE